VLPALVVLGLYSHHFHAETGPKQAVIHQVVTESITRTTDGASTTTVRQEQRSVAHVTAGDGNTLTDWLSSKVDGENGAGTNASTRRRGAATHSDADGPEHVVSRATVLASASGTGLMNKWYYRFENVRLSRDKLTVYYDPETFTPPENEHWVDMISGNTTSPEPPTMIVLKGDLHNTKWFYLPIEYLPATEHQPQCVNWVDQVAYLLQVRYSYNIWHTWNEGLMGLFQTLRELGQLPLASVGAGGAMEEIIDGMGEGCPWAWDPLMKQVRQETSCSPRSGLLERTRCDPATERWCRQGAVVSARRETGGPVIVPYTASSVMNVWAHLYSSMTKDLRDWSDVEGACFSSLVLGKSSTLNFYQAINNTDPDPDTLAKYPRTDNLASRVEAMAVFKSFVHGAQKEYIEEEEAKGAQPWGGYRSRSLERLRAGVGPEDIVQGVLDGINAREVPGMLREERNELRQRWKMHDRLVERAVERYMQKYGGMSEAMAAAAAAGESHQDDYEDDYEGVAARVAAGKVDVDELAAAQAADGEEGEEDGVAGGVLLGGGADADIVATDLGGDSGSDGAVEGGAAGEDLSWEEGDAAADDGGAADKRKHKLKRSSSRRNRHLLSKGESRTGKARKKFLESDAAATGDAAVAADNEWSGARPAVRTPGALSSSPASKKWFNKEAVFRHESPRPVVTYMSRNFFSRGVLNEGDILAYVLARYNVTVRVTTFEEPLHLVMDCLATTDVLIGMHGAGWTNGLFVKRGATTLQMYPYGWRLPDNSTLRGYNYREIVLASECPYDEWVNPVRENAFFRRSDYSKKEWNQTYALHPEPDMPLPTDGWPGNLWIYQNTYIDMNLFGPVLDDLMATAGIKPMPGLVD
jgi:hypothetical protein